MLTRKNASELDLLKKQVLGFLPEARLSSQTSLHSYAQKSNLPLDLVLVNRLNEPILIASSEASRAKILFRDYPKLEWICDLSTRPTRVLTKTGTQALSELTGIKEDPTQHTLLGRLLALGAVLIVAILIILICKS